MSEPTIDPERLAALLDGRLPQAERAELLARLAASGETLEAYADAAAVLGELNQRPIRRAIPSWGWVALAAVLAGVVLTPLVWTRGKSDRDDPARFVASLSSPGAGLPAGWDTAPWSDTRGAGAPLSSSVRAARVGARLVDLEIALGARDTTAGVLAAEIGTLLEGVPAAGPVVALYGEIARRAGAPPAELAPLARQARLGAARLVGAHVVGLAAWAEAGRIAAARRDTAFFRSRETQRELERAGRTMTLAPEAARIVQDLGAELAAGGQLEGARMADGVSELLRVLGSE